MYDFFGVKVLHSRCNLPGPGHNLGRKNFSFDLFIVDVVVESPTSTVLHHHTEARVFGAQSTACECVCACVCVHMCGGPFMRYNENS